MGWDGIVVGGGVNGLTAAAYLARAGRRVVLIERGGRLGGRAALEEFHPGYRAPGLLHDTSGVRPRVVSDLELEACGLSYREEEAPILALAAEGGGLLLYRDAERGAAQIDRISEKDGSAYRDWRAQIDGFAGALSPLLNEPPPELVACGGGGGPWQLVRKALGARWRLGGRSMVELLRVLPMPLEDWLGERFESDLLKAAIAAGALEGAWMGPRSPGSAALLLFEECAAGREVAGGPAALTAALAGRCRDAGVELRTGCEVRSIDVKDGRAVGVTLAGGDPVECELVLSSLDPRRTMLELLSADAIPPSVAQELAHYRMRGTTFVVRLALDGPLEIPGHPVEAVERLRISESLDELERAFDALKYGEASKVPQLDVRVPTATDSSLAPPGHHVVTILARFAPYHLKKGWSAKRRERFAEAVVDRLAAFAPALKKRIVAREALSPVDLEERYALTGGHVHHGEPSLDQLLSLRPTARLGRYRTPVEGLFLCGAGTHPGGTITCAPGALAARAAL